MNRELLPSSAFNRALRKLLKRRSDLQPDVETALERLAEDAFDPRLKTHKLTGALADRWACTAGYDLRILFRFVQHEGNEAILLLTIGTHEEVY